MLQIAMPEGTTAIIERNETGASEALPQNLGDLKRQVAHERPEYGKELLSPDKEVSDGALMNWLREHLPREGRVKRLTGRLTSYFQRTDKHKIVL